jgi:hypothetical protein
MGKVLRKDFCHCISKEFRKLTIERVIVLHFYGNVWVRLKGKSNMSRSNTA